MSGVNIQISNSKSSDKNIFKLSAGDIRNLTYYLHVQSHPLKNIENIGQNGRENIPVGLDLNKKSTKNSQPLTDTYQIHHNYRPNHQRHRPYTKNVSDKPKISLSLNLDKRISLELAICGMKKNTRLPVPHKNFSLIDGCFGDDAGFIIQKDQRNFLGISDGAGGNLMYGYNPRLFSESLMRNCSDLAHTGRYCTSQPKRLLCHAFDRVQMEKCFGSATACVLGIDCSTGRLYSVNIGDSGFVIVRQGCVIYRSRSQAMDGDCPRQLDVYPWTASLQGHGINYTQISSLDAICDTFDLELDDIIILSTDGLFDNVPNFLIEKILSQNHSLKKSANDLVTRAVRYYLKPDDILVIMARITPINNSISKQSK